jgi:hypothetical protein
MSLCAAEAIRLARTLVLLCPASGLEVRRPRL